MSLERLGRMFFIVSFKVSDFLFIVVYHHCKSIVLFITIIFIDVAIDVFLYEVKDIRQLTKFLVKLLYISSDRTTECAH